MANPHQPGGGSIGPGNLPPLDPIDPEQIRQIQLLARAQLRSFSATPATVGPNGHVTLAWDIAMPTQVYPVPIEVHLHGVVDQVVEPQGSRVITHYRDTTYAVYLKAPLAVRQLGTVQVITDFGMCKLVDVAPVLFKAAVKSEADKAFPSGGKVTLRGGGANIDIGINSFVIDIPLEAHVPNWFNADIDVSVGYSVLSDYGQVRVVYDFARTTASFGTVSAILSGGCSAAVAIAIEEMVTGFLDGFIGQVIAGRIANSLVENVNENLMRLNNAGPQVPFKFYDLNLTDVGMTYRFCPDHPYTPSDTHQPPGGGNHPILNG